MMTKEILSALDWLTKNGELRDYDDEIANRIEDVKDIVRLHDRLLAAAPPSGIERPVRFRGAAPERSSSIESACMMSRACRNCGCGCFKSNRVVMSKNSCGRDARPIESMVYLCSSRGSYHSPQATLLVSSSSRRAARRSQACASRSRLPPAQG